MDLAVQLAFGIIGWKTRTICYIERESYAAAALVARMGDETLDQAPIWDDLRSFNGRRWRGKVDCILAGYPCQPFSCAGKRLGERDPRHLWPDVDRIIGETQPWIVVLENVDDHLRMGFGIVRRDLERRGYTVAPGLFSAAEVGASHERQRLVIVAHRPGDGRQSGTISSQWRQESADVDRTEETMGHAESCTRRAELESREQAASRRTGSERASRDLGDSDKPRLERRKLRRGECTDERIVGSAGCEIPTFPPPPSDPDWTDIVARWPELSPAVAIPARKHVGLARQSRVETDSAQAEPDVQRMADGLAAGSHEDRLRLIGNGVVPLAIAYAIITLGAAEAARIK